MIDFRNIKNIIYEGQDIVKIMTQDGAILWQKSDDYITKLRNMGCRFWAPLNKDDVAEKLSGTEPEYRTGLFEWDPEMDAYRFKTFERNQQVLVYYIPDVNNVSETLSYTLIADVYGISYNGTIDFYTCGQTATNDTATSCSTGLVHRYGTFTNGAWHKMVQTVSGNTLKFYTDGVLTNISSNISLYPSPRPSCWAASSVRDYTTIGNVWNNYTFEAYFKNIYLFDHVLTEEEFSLLQYR